MNISSLSPTNIAFRTQTPPVAVSRPAQPSARSQTHIAKPVSTLTASADQPPATTRAGSLLDTLV